MCVSSSAATPYMEGGGGGGMTSHGGQSPSAQPYAPTPEVLSQLYSASMPMRTASVSIPRCSWSPSTQLVPTPNSESLGPPVCPQARSSDPFPSLEGASKGNAPGLRWDTPGLGPFVACPAAQSGVLLTSWVWRVAAPRRGLGEAAGFGPGWDIFW